MHTLTRFKRWLLGVPINPFVQKDNKNIYLIAILAWVGLGADGLSSSCYGPEEAYLALGAHTNFALYIAIATTITVFVLAMSYNQVIELFPSGGGGYKVSTLLLGPYFGLISGAALVIDYALTIAVSTASGMDALFSFLPKSFGTYKLTAEVSVLGLLLLLNMRGIQESIKVLMPIFLSFFVTHVILIIYGIYAHHHGLSLIIPDTLRESKEAMETVGFISVIALILHAYSLGSGTYTGLEAVSNSINRLREPRIMTGKWTMLYMALSLSFTASGIILLYLLWEPTHIPGQTLNAVVFSKILGNSFFGENALIIVLLLEAGLLLVAANSGFIAGPTVLANMAIDGWMPNRFRLVSSRLVIQNGMLLYGFLALAILLWCHGKVSLLVVLYSINVFITFSLTLLGLCIYWLKKPGRETPGWRRRLALSITGFIISISILIITIIAKFESGGWLTVLITCTLIGICLLIKKHYDRVAKSLRQVDKQLMQPIDEDHPAPLIDANEPTAIILVGKHPGVAMHTLLNVIRMFPKHFKNFIFISAGIVDVASFTAKEEITKIEEQVNKNLDYFKRYCHQYGLAAESYAVFGTDTIHELSKLSEKITKQYANCIFFASKLVFDKDNYITRLLHNETAITLQRQLHMRGKELVILPMKIWR